MKGRKIHLGSELRATVILAAPIVLNQAGQMSMGLVDTMVAGRISTVAIAGLGLGANFFWTFASVCSGFLLALDTWFSQAAGAGDETSMRRFLSQSLWSCLAVTLFAGVGLLGGGLAYYFSAEPGPTRDAFVGYVAIVAWCLPSIFLFFALQRYWQARHKVIAFSVIIIGANVLNLAGNLAFGLGKWGFPKMEIQGLAISTVICRYAMLAAAAAYTFWQLKPARIKVPRLDLGVQKAIFKLGWPAAGHTALELGAFTVATFLVALLGSTPLAAHHICLMMTTFTFMFSLGLSAAAAVRVGRFIGAGEPRHAVLAGWLCIGLALVMMSCFAACYLLFSRQIMGVFTQDPRVIELGVRILMVVALFQVADGAQVCTIGALRGLGNTQTAMYANFIGHYPIGLVLGTTICFGLGLGVIGMWWGLAAGLSTVAVVVLWKWRSLTRNFTMVEPLSHNQRPPGRATAG